MYRWLRMFLIVWVSVFILSFLTAEIGMSALHRLGVTAGLAMVTSTLLVFPEKSAYYTKQANLEMPFTLVIHRPWDPTIIYRVEDQLVFIGVDEVPIYEIRGNKIYPWRSRRHAFQIEKNRVYRGGDPKPFLEIKEDKIYHISDEQVIYEIKVVW